MLAHLCKAPLNNIARGRDKKNTSTAPCQAAARPAPSCGSHGNQSLPPTQIRKANNRAPFVEAQLQDNAKLKRSKSHGEISCPTNGGEDPQPFESTHDDIQLQRERTSCNKNVMEMATIYKDGCTVNSKVRCSGVLQRMRRFRLKHVLETHAKDSSCPNLSYKVNQCAKPRGSTQQVCGSTGCERLVPPVKDDLHVKSSSKVDPSTPLINEIKNNRNPRPDLINSVLERTTNATLAPDTPTAHKHAQLEPSCSQTALPESSSTLPEKHSCVPKTDTITDNFLRKRTAARKKCASPFGYDIENIATFLQMASRTEPANIPMVLTQNVVIRSTSGATNNNFSVPMGNVVNAMYKTGAWVYVRTAHGSEGLLPYKACVPLGILPANTRHSAPWELENTLLDTTTTEHAYPSICNVVEVNSTITDQVEVNPTSHKKTEDSSQAVYENLDFLIHVPTPSFDLDDVSCLGEGNGNLDFSVKPPYPNKTDTQKLMEFSSTTLPEKPATPISAESSQELQAGDQQPVATPAATQHEVQVMVVCDYIAKGHDRITVKNGEMVTLLQRTSADWLLVRTSSGLQGLIPTAYTTIGTQCFL